MSRYYVKVFTDDSNEKEWNDLNPDEIHHIEFKGKWYDEVQHGRWTRYEYSTNNRWRKCSVCGKGDEYINEFGFVAIRNYCPNCGAKMDDNWEEPAINPCRGCKDYDGKGGCISNGGCGAKMDEVEK